MRALSISELLGVWERGLGEDAAARGILLLEAAESASTRDELEELPIGARDSRLLQLRTRLFGPSLASIAVCPACGERLEVSFSADDVQMPDRIPRRTGTVERDGYRVVFRLPNSGDLIALARERCASVDEARDILLHRCMTSIEPHEAQTSIRDLPAAIIEEISDQMSQMDPGGDLRIAVACARCGHSSELPLDVPAFFWSEIHFWATQTLHEVHGLASAYGWSERDILAMTPERRRFYLGAISE